MRQYSSEIANLNSSLHMTYTMAMCMCIQTDFQKVDRI